MNPDTLLRVLSRIMKWEDDRSREEFEWLNLMARLKYDGYRDFQAGMRFIESLVAWLQQFQPADREAAFAFARHAIVFVSVGEMAHLVEQFYPTTVLDRVVRTVAKQRGIPTYRVIADASEDLKLLRRKTLFMGLSDGARLDTIRHSTSGLLSNEQFVQSTQIDTDKWRDLLKNLRKDLNDQEARFRLVYLVDDFTGTGTSFLRFDQDKEQWKGKLIRFRDSVQHATDAMNKEAPFDRDWELCIHHYVASESGVKSLGSHLSQSKDEFVAGWAQETHCSFGMTLPPNLPITNGSEESRAFVRLTEAYYDPQIQTQHTAVGGVEHLGLGYGSCALPLILEHNTPNNSVALLWAESKTPKSDGVATHAMRPLFRRRERHS